MWNKGNEIGKLYILSESDLSRVGDSWMRGRLRAGDVVLCIAHTGDCFNDYLLVVSIYNGLFSVKESRFGAYTLGTLLEWQPSNAECTYLLSGVHVTNGIDEHPLHAELEKRKAAHDITVDN